MQNTKDLLAKIRSSNSDVPNNQHGEHLVDAINRCKQNRHQMVNEEMKVILEERDSAVAKVTVFMSAEEIHVFIQIVLAENKSNFW